MTVSLEVAGKNILITGAKAGLGRQIGDELAQRGARVFGTSRDEESARVIAERYGTPACVLDVQDLSTIEPFVDRVFSDSGGIDVLINNAGINIPKPSLEVTLDDWRSVVQTNLDGPFFLSTAVARRWVDSGSGGNIINIASQAGVVAIEERAAYGASKAGLIHLTKVLALEWASQGIRVNGIAPTFVRTEMTESTLARKEWAAELLSRIPMGRFGEPEDIVGAVILLASDASSMITGQTIVVDGGYTLR